MSKTLPTAEDVIEIVQKLIAKEGVKAFETNGRVQLYSGPLILSQKLLKQSKITAVLLHKQKTKDHLGPIDSRLEPTAPLRFMPPASSHQSKALQYG